MCRAVGEGGRRCQHGRPLLDKHNDRRRVNRAIRRNVAAWARRNGVAHEEVARLADAPPKVAKDWIRQQGLNPDDFADGVPSARAASPASPASPTPGQAAVSDRAPRPAVSPAPGDADVWAKVLAESRPAEGRDAAGSWCTPELGDQIGSVMADQGGHRDERSLLASVPVKVTTLGCGAVTGSPRAGSNTTRRVELDNGMVGYFKPFGTENKGLERGFGQDSAQQSVHEAAAWRLARGLGPPWSEIVPPVVIRDLAGETGSLALERPGRTGRHDVQTTAEWREAAFFDCLLGQQDRHAHNYLVAGDRITLIDHGYTFARPGDYRNASHLVARRVAEGETALTYQERDALQRLLGSPDLMGLGKVLQPARAAALRRRAEVMLASGYLTGDY